MHIEIKNNYLTYGDYKIKCAVGKRGINYKKKEGDLITPKGSFKIKGIFYRKDKIPKLKTKIKKKSIKRNMGWCDDPRSDKYNKLIKYPFNYGSEKGDSICQNMLGIFYQKGIYVDKDKKQAFKYFLISAKNGDVEG